MKEAIDIIKHRWREVAVIVALGILASALTLLINYVTKPSPTSGALTSLMIALYAAYLLIIIINIVIFLGFYRSVAINAFERKRLFSLCLTGKTFFWRTLALWLLYLLCFYTIDYVCFLILKASLSFSEYPLYSFFGAATWVRGLCFMFAMMLLAIPYVLAGALIVVRDCGVGQALKNCFNLKLAGSNLAAIATAAALLSSLVMFVPDETGAATLIGITKIGYNAVMELAYIFVGVVAVRMLTAQMGWSARVSSATPLPSLQ